MDAISERMPFDELEKTQEYQTLTPKQKLFVATYCQGGLVDGIYDPVSATRTAYECKSMEVARIMSYSLMSNIRVIAALNRHFNVLPIEEFLRVIDRAIHNKRLTLAQVQALRLKCEIMGYATRLPGTGPTGHIPKDVQEASREARKAKRKTPVRTPKEEVPSQWNDFE